MAKANLLQNFLSLELAETRRGMQKRRLEDARAIGPGMCEFPTRPTPEA